MTVFAVALVTRASVDADLVTRDLGTVTASSFDLALSAARARWRHLVGPGASWIMVRAVAGPGRVKDRRRRPPEAAREARP